MISPPPRALIRLMASGATARPARRPPNPSATSTRLALGEICSPAPTSSSRSAFSMMTTRKPCCASASDAVKPPIPAPAMKMVRDVATDRSGGLVPHHAFRRTRFAGLEVSGVAKQGRAIGTDDLVVVAEIEEDMGVIERRVSAHTHEFPRADLDDRYTGVIVKVRYDMLGHYVHLGWQSSRTQST